MSFGDNRNALTGPVGVTTVVDLTSAGAEKAGSLENSRITFRPGTRNRRYDQRSGLWNVSSLPRCRKCGRAVVGEGGLVGVRVTDGRAGFSGLASCGSVWVCPVCSIKVQARRSLEIGCGVATAVGRGLPVAMITLTMRHDRGQRLDMLWSALSKSWNRVTGGTSWIAAVERYGIHGWVRVVEVTIGDNGWHVHVHALFFGDGLTSAALDEMAEGMFGRWSRSLQRSKLRAPLPSGQDWHLVTEAGDGSTIGDYLAKAFREPKTAGALGAEMTLTQSKTAQGWNKTRPVMSLLDEGALDGEVRPLRIWHEWEKGSKGRRQIAWSKGLRQELGLVEVEKTDEEIAAEVLGSKDDTVVQITSRGYGQLVRRPNLIPDVLNGAEQLSAERFSAWLWQEGIEHWRTK